MLGASERHGEISWLLRTRSPSCSVPRFARLRKGVVTGGPSSRPHVYVRRRASKAPIVVVSWLLPTCSPPSPQDRRAPAFPRFPRFIALDTPSPCRHHLGPTSTGAGSAWAAQNQGLLHIRVVRQVAALRFSTSSNRPRRALPFPVPVGDDSLEVVGRGHGQGAPRRAGLLVWPTGPADVVGARRGPRSRGIIRSCSRRSRRATTARGTSLEGPGTSRSLPRCSGSSTCGTDHEVRIAGGWEPAVVVPPPVALDDHHVVAVHVADDARDGLVVPR
jgi:hypothetical protein